MNNPKRYTITAALPYTNGPVHIGHLAGVYIPADIYARYLRLKGEDVLFVCGSDEHGVPITIKAKQENISPQKVVDKYHHIIKNSFAEFGISFDIYSRTSSKIHHETAQEFFKTLYDKGEFTEQITLQYYDEEQKQFLADRYIEGTCPKCSYERAYGDQCEKCGTSLNPTDLINPKSKLSGNKPILKETKHWFLPLDKYEPWIRKWILEDHKNDWKPNVYGQCKSWLDTGGGLQPRAMTRDLDWGVPVPKEIPGADGKVLYVWFDAPIGYISATKEYFQQPTPNPSQKEGNFGVADTISSPSGRSGGASWELYWKDKETKLVHFIGKDNIVFHCIIFPAILKAHGDYILPDNVPANEFLNLEGEKISTSRNWAVWLNEYLQDFPNRQDELRYVLTRYSPETSDNDFSWKNYQASVNGELVAVLGNFVNRVMELIHRTYDGKVPVLDKKYFSALTNSTPAERIDKHDKIIIQLILKNYVAPFPNVQDGISAHIDNYKFRDALSLIMQIAREGNAYLSVNEPWKLIKIGTDNLKIKVPYILNLCIQVIANLAILIEPFLPFTSKKLFKMLNLDESFLKWENAGRLDLLPEGHQLNKPELLFPKVEDAEIEKQIQKLLNSKKLNTPPDPLSERGKSEIANPKSEISFDDFSKMDIRVGTILEAEKVPKTDKLLKLKIDTGIDVRTVVSGIAAYYKPEEIIGQKVSILVNLAPRKLKGIDSQGMILMAENSNGELSFVTPTKPVDNGSTVK